MKRLELTDEEAEVLDNYVFRKMSNLEVSGLTDTKCYPIFVSIHRKLNNCSKKLDFVDFVDNCAKLKQIEADINKLDTQINDLDTLIDKNEDTDLATDLLKLRNNLHKEQLNARSYKLTLEKAILDFEINSAQSE